MRLRSKRKELPLSNDTLDRCLAVPLSVRLDNALYLICRRFTDFGIYSSFRDPAGQGFNVKL